MLINATVSTLTQTTITFDKDRKRILWITWITVGQRYGLSATQLNLFIQQQLDVNTPSVMTSPFGIHIEDEEAVPPKVVVLLCESIQRACSESPEQLLHLVDDAPTAEYEQVREELDAGNLVSSSPQCMFALLLAYLRELPEPLIPQTYYMPALDAVGETMRARLEELCQSPAYVKYLHLVLPSIQTDEFALTQATKEIIQRAWSDMKDELIGDAKHALKLAEVPLADYAFHVRQPTSLFEEVYFCLPKSARKTLEYLCVSIVKWHLSLLEWQSQQAVDDTVSASSSSHPKHTGDWNLLHTVSTALAPHILQPFAWNTDIGCRWKRRRHQVAFTRLAFCFMQKKHNHLTSEERKAMAMDTRDLLSVQLERVISQCSAGSSTDKQVDPTLLKSRTLTTTSFAPLSSTTQAESNHCLDTSKSIIEVMGTTHSVASDQTTLHAIVTRKVVIGATFFTRKSDSYVNVEATIPWSASEMVSADDNGAFMEGPSSSTSAVSDTMAVERGGVAIPHTMNQAPVIDIDWLKKDLELYNTSELLSQCPRLKSLVHHAFNPFEDISTHGDNFALDSVSVPRSSLQNGYVPTLHHSTVPAPAFDLIQFLSPTPSDCQSSTLVTEADGTSSVNANSAAAATMEGINFDYAIPFPRTVTSGMVVQAPVLSMAEQVLKFGAERHKSKFFADSDTDFLNYKLPQRGSDSPVCEQCRCALVGGLSLHQERRRTFCRYCQRSMCISCCNGSFVIPSYMLNKANFQTHSVCTACEDHLRKHFTKPVLRMDWIGRDLRRDISESVFTQVVGLRAKLQKQVYFHILPGCNSKESVLALIPRSLFMLVAQFQSHDDARMSPSLLIRIQTENVLSSLEQVHRLLECHILSCDSCRAPRFCCSEHLCALTADLPDDLAQYLPTSSFDVSGVSPLDDSQPQMQYQHRLSASSAAPLTASQLTEESTLMLCRTCCRYGHSLCFSHGSRICTSCQSRANTTQHDQSSGYDPLFAEAIQDHF
eukprot:m.243608 g.243608  ORF g.243608 m.243608 type:complete len:995 (+) comp15347_c0_seq3:696-3680(+)